MERNPQIFAFKIRSRRLPHWIGNSAKAFLGRLFGFERFNAIYRALPPCEAADYPRVFLSAMDVRLELGGRGLDEIPRTGPLIVVGNHPFGMIEGMSIDAALLTVRPDVTAMATHWLTAIPEFAERFIFVDPGRNRRRRKLNAHGWRRAFQWLSAGHAMLVFPAGRVSRFEWRRMRVAELPWSPHVASLARRMRAPVLPIYTHGQCSAGFQLAGAVAPALQDFLLIREAISMRGRTLHATIGRLIQPEELLRFATDAEATGFLWRETEKLARANA